MNDAVAFKTAHVGIAMGGAGSDIAEEAADIALVHNAGSVLVVTNAALLYDRNYASMRRKRSSRLAAGENG